MTTLEPPSTDRRARDLWRQLLWRVLAFAVVYAMAVAALGTGVGVSERDLAGSGLAQRAYYALGLFVLGGLDIGTPEGGPFAGRVVLWSAYFLAPIITVSALVETAVRLVRPLAIRIRPLRGHVVLGGAGRLSLLYVRKLRQQDRRRTIVVVELNSGHPHIGELRAVHNALVITGDITSDEVLARLRLDRAHRVLLLTGDDFANLDAAAKILRRAPSLARKIVVHVSDLGFMRETAGSSVARECEVFNGHEFAATHLVREHLVKRFRATPDRDLVLMAGFGRFGQTVLHQLQQRALGSFSHVVIVDQMASRKTSAFEEQPGFAEGYERTVIDGDMLDPEIWRRISRLVEEHGHDPVVVLGSGEDGINLQAALRVRKQHPEAYVIIRSFRASPFTDELAKEAGAQAFHLAGLIESGMPEEWF